MPREQRKLELMPSLPTRATSVSNSSRDPSLSAPHGSQAEPSSQAGPGPSSQAAAAAAVPGDKYEGVESSVGGWAGEIFKEASPVELRQRLNEYYSLVQTEFDNSCPPPDSTVALLLHTTFDLDHPGFAMTWVPDYGSRPALMKQSLGQFLGQKD